MVQSIPRSSAGAIRTPILAAIWLMPVVGCHAPGSTALGVQADRHSEGVEPVWLSARTDAAPLIDGRVDSVWQRATPLVVSVREAIGGSIGRTVVLRALHTMDTLYVLAEWNDATRSDMRDPYVWSKDRNEYERPTRPDDQFALEFPIDGNFDVNMLAVGANYTADVWHWKAGRGNPVGWVDDKRHIISSQPLDGAQEYAFGKHGKVYIARPMDAGTPSYVVKPKPSAAAGDEIDSFQPQEPSGSVADLSGKAVYNGPGWTLEMCRKLDSGHADDAVLHLDRDNPCAIAVLDDGPNGGHRMPRQNFWHDFDALRRRAGLPPVSLRDFRKSSCTNLPGAVPLHVVQELAGHSGIRTTRRYYLKMQPEFIATARAAAEVAPEVQE